MFTLVDSLAGRVTASLLYKPGEILWQLLTVLTLPPLGPFFSLDFSLGFVNTTLSNISSYISLDVSS